MAAITVEEQKLYALIMAAVKQAKADLGFQQRQKWIDGDEAMKLLGISSKTTLQKYRDTGVIRFTQPDKKIILYDIDSIDAFLEKHAREPFK